MLKKRAAARAKILARAHARACAVKQRGAVAGGKSGSSGVSQKPQKAQKAVKAQKAQGA